MPRRIPTGHFSCSIYCVLGALANQVFEVREVGFEAPGKAFADYADRVVRVQAFQVDTRYFEVLYALVAVEFRVEQAGGVLYEFDVRAV